MDRRKALVAAGALVVWMALISVLHLSLNGSDVGWFEGGGDHRPKLRVAYIPVT